MMEKYIELFKRYFDYKNLESFAAEIKEKGGLRESLAFVLLAQVFSFLGAALGTVVGSFFNPELAELISVYGLLSFILMAILGIPFFYIFSGAVYSLSTLLGGKGTFQGQSYALSIIGFAAGAAVLPVSILSSVPVLELPVSIASLALVAYMIYAQFKTVKAVQQLSSLKAFAVVGVFWLAMLVVMTLIIMATMPVPVPS
ncbi:hypothetical protein GF318_01170 [Candidatus Micrarchaeota archaeon]|nr:hypothetical protein [Candidatus Micrarchaeota archaeon]